MNFTITKIWDVEYANKSSLLAEAVDGTPISSQCYYDKAWGTWVWSVSMLDHELGHYTNCRSLAEAQHEAIHFMQTLSDHIVPSLRGHDQSLSLARAEAADLQSTLNLYESRLKEAGEHTFKRVREKSEDWVRTYYCRPKTGAS